jgi:hypothetical protein
MPSATIRRITMKFTIDRFEGDFAVVELDDQTMENIPRRILPSQANEGDIISLEIDVTETQKRREYIKKLMDDVWAD